MTDVIIDPYDDGFGTLGEIFAEVGAPDFIKTASRLSDGERENLPDHCFALIMRDGDQQLRKYACVDKAHTAVNVLYLNSRGGSLLPPALQKAAANLCLACERYDLEVPEHLQKLAQPKKPLIKTDGPTDLLIKGAPKSHRESFKPLSQTVEKTAAWDPYVDVTNRWPQERAVDTAEHTVNFLGKELPLDSVTQVKLASIHFEQDWRTAHPAHRRETAVAIAERARPLQVTLGANLEKYAHTTARPMEEIGEALIERARRWPADRAEAASAIAAEFLDKYAQSTPDYLAEVLNELDVATELDQIWGIIPDPWETVLGKVAAETRRWELGKVAVDEAQVRQLATQRRDQVETVFGKDLAAGLAEDPVTVFDSLPVDTQAVLANMAIE